MLDNHTITITITHPSSQHGGVRFFSRSCTPAWGWFSADHEDVVDRVTPAILASHEAAIAEACRAVKVAAVVGMPTCVVEETAQTTATTWYNSATVYGVSAIAY